ncbi:MAG TPA: hypothetical protein VN625_02010 [Desulfuromonadaceae bacterium]|nr:hypothetical protein [Desulfuromonadaceae bacterium]
MTTKTLIPFLGAVIFFFLHPATTHAEDTPIMPLSEIKPGMLGEWHTTVSGSRVDSFPLEVVGVVENFIGPQRPVIICKALDATNKLTGPVAGMSGSPCYINGKLIGAYAYGFLFPKDQALIGVTPIESMLEVLTNYPLPKPSAGNITRPETSIATANPEWLGAPAADVPGLPSPATLQSVMKPLPTPVFVSGVSERVLQKFSARLSALGLDVMQAPAGHTSHDIDNDPKPGQPVAGVLMSGDFNFAGTGTVTWRNGDRLLAFGHPFFESGSSAMPMASAEILTVVQSVMRSFKLSNTGPIIGTIYQDRLTCIAGEIGPKPDTTHFEIQVEAPHARSHVYQAEMFQNQNFSPILAAISLLESLYASTEHEEEQTIYLDSTIEVAGHPPIKRSDVAGEPDGGFELAFGQIDLFESLWNNPVEFPNVKSVNFHIRMADGWKAATLNSLEIDKHEARAGDTVNAIIGLHHFRGEPSSIPVTIPVPAGLPPSDLEIFVGDADAARLRDEPPPVPPQSLEQILGRLRMTRSHQDICVKLLANTPGIAVEGKNLPDLPPSVIAQFASPNGTSQKATIRRVTLWETNFPVQGTFRGQITLPVRIK